MLFALTYYDVTNWIYTWVPVIAIVLMVFFMYRLLKVMPRTKPQQVKPTEGPPINWEDIAGADEAKEELQEIVEFLRSRDRFAALDAQVPRGVMLHGPPGTGKTLLAKAVAHESGAQFFSQSAASFVEMFAGLGAMRVRRLFREARKAAPSIIFIDELDAVGGRRGADITGERDQTLNQLLIELDGFSARDAVVVIAASNLLDKLDPALLRPGRFDRQIFVSPPDVRGRKGILEAHTRLKPLGEDVDLELVARQTAGLAGADLANIANEAAIHAARRGGVLVTKADFDTALERVVAGMQSRRVLNVHERSVVAYHEAGHALCAELLPGVDRVHRVSIVPRGRALGYTLNLPDEDRYLKTREELLDYMTVLLGGRVAEQLVFGAITTGASDDLKRVAEISRAMVADYAMSNGMASMRAFSADNASEATRRMHDREQQELADYALRHAHELITANRDLLEELAQTLLTNELLERDDIDRIVGARGTRAARTGLDIGLAAAKPPAAPQ